MGNIATLLQPLGALFGQKIPSSNAATSALNTSGSAYDLNSNNSASPLISNGLSGLNIAIIGGVALVLLLFWKKK